MRNSCVEFRRRLFGRNLGEEACMGALYKRGNIWWIKYYANGRPVRESAGTEKARKARSLLKEREGRVATGQPILPRADRVRFEEAAKDLVNYYETTGKRNLEEVGWRLKGLSRFCAGRRLSAIGPADTTAYATQRQTEGASAGTVNRELALLKRLMRLAYENGKLVRLPVIRMLKEAAPRSGFFEQGQFTAVRRHLPRDLQVAVTIAHTYGWRIRSEVMSLKLTQVDLDMGTLRLEPGETKNNDGRLVYLTPELQTMLRSQIDRIKALMRAQGALIPYLFPHVTGRCKGKPRRDFVKAWKSACLSAMLEGKDDQARAKLLDALKHNPRLGLLGMLRHDMRRTAVRNLVNAGVSERVAMQITGHRTRSVFDRYHIVSPADLREATQKLTGTITGTGATSPLAPTPANALNCNR
jgi:integrase